MDLRTVIAGLVGTASKGVRVSPLADYYTRYVGALLERALTGWASVHAAGIRCAIELEGPLGDRNECGAPAIGACMVCGKPVCVGHALVSPEHILCLGCAYAAKRLIQLYPPEPAAESYRAKRPPWEQPASSPFGFVDSERETEERRQRARHLSVLGLGEDATPNDVKEAYRRLARANHPDRAKTDEQRKARERKLKELNDAYERLVKRQRTAA